MHATLEAICVELDQLAAQVKSSIPNDEPFAIAQGNWSFPGLTRPELVEAAESVATLILERGGDSLGDSEARLSDYVRRLQYLRASTVPNIWGNAAQGATAYMLTLDGLQRALAPVLTNDPTLENAAAVRRVATQVRAMEVRVKGLEPRSAALANMVERIESAYNAADQLPTDLETLAESRQKVQELLREAERDRAHLSATREEADGLSTELKQNAGEADAVLARCESAYSAATSQGLAAAFAERSKALDKSMWAWVLGLVLALILGGYLGSRQLHQLSELIKDPATKGSLLSLDVVLSLLSVGAPVWFAWLATKQVGQRFRLSEDYAFKASISRAYEGYRREAARIDTDLEASLLASALNRLDELPLRLVETTTHGSPWHELMASDVVKDAAKTVPGFAGKVVDLANDALARLGKPKGEKVASNAFTKEPPEGNA
ncbi:hypothetical protein ACOCG7_24790 [Paraburkholderia sp. DD10]|jgi:hypothetical protein|uniref:hypothetical protein n=1 Tax=Paraburkholderia TaxID=1822464 RepID=UPI003A0C416B